MKGFIYVITNDVNGKQYVGKTTDTLENRFKDHCKPYMLKHKIGRPLYAAMDKYGVEHFSIASLGEYPEEELAKQEQFWIDKLDTYNNGYNATIGGEGTQKYNYDLFVEEYSNGLLMTDIAKKYQCDIGTVSRALHNNNIDTKRNLGKVKHDQSIAIEQYSLDGQYIQQFESIWAAATWIVENKYTTTTNINQVHSNISASARHVGYRKSAYKFKWKIIKE